MLDYLIVLITVFVFLCIGIYITNQCNKDSKQILYKVIEDKTKLVNQYSDLSVQLINKISSGVPVNPDKFNYELTKEAEEELEEPEDDYSISGGLN